MVNEKRLLLLVTFAFVILLVFVNGVSAAIAVTAPANNSNNSGTSTFTATFTNVTDGITNPTNASFYYNLSGAWTKIGNTSVANGCSAGTCTVNLSTTGLTDGRYSINVTLDNGTDQASATLLTQGVRFDNTAPAVVAANFTPSDGTATTSAFISLLNLTLTDAEVGTFTNVIFNVTNSSGAVALLNASNPAGNSWNATFNLTNLNKVNYTIRIQANDSLGNVNNSVIISLIYDTTAPSAISLTNSTSTTTSKIIGDIVITEALSGVNSTCTVDSTNVVITGTNDSQTLTHLNLGCGETKNYVLTCTDSAGNTATSSTISLSTNECPSGGGSSGGTIATQVTFTPSETQLSDGYSKLLKEDERIQFVVSKSSHHVKLLDVSGKSATIEIASDPVKVTLDEGQDAKIDVNDDGVYDVYVKLNSVVGTQANIVVQKINEAISSGDGSVKDTDSGTTVKTEGTVGSPVEEEVAEKSNKSLVIMVIVVIAIILLAVALAMRNKKQRYMMYGF